MSKKKLLILFISILVTWAVFFLIHYQNKKEMFRKGSAGITDDPNARIEYERKMLAEPQTGMIPANIREKELAFVKNLPTTENRKLLKGAKTKILAWSSRGPINRGGRTRALGIDVRTQTAPNITIIAGGASGGIYKSTDNGVTWINKLSPDVIHSITSIVQDTRSGEENTWYVGTGERGSNLVGGGYNSNSTLFLGDGIFKSTDNGESWTLLPATSNASPQSYSQAFDFVFNVAVNKTTGSVFAAASNTIQRSTNGGTTWSTVRGSLANNAYTDVQISSTGVIYATIYYGLTNSGISRSTDDGASWALITPSTWPSVYGRTVLGIAPSNENIVYFWTYTGSGSTGTQLWKYTYPGSGNGTGDANWTNLTANLPVPTGNVAGTNVQSAYDMIVKVKPDDANFVILGGTNLYRSTNGFSTAVSPTGSTGWIGGYAIVNDISQYANHHPDQHSMVFLNSDPKVLYSGHDGGLSKTTDITASTVTWSNLNQGYITSQFYAIDIDPNTSDDPVIAGGMQDNGNYITFSTNYNTGWTDWNHGGDGAFAGVRKTGANEYTIYVEAQNGWLWRQTYNNSGTILTDSFLQPTYTGNFAFVNPFTLDPIDNSIMYFAQGDSVIRSNNVSTGTPTWTPLSHTTTGTSITAIGVSKLLPGNRLYVGSSGGKVLKLESANSGNPTAVDLSAALVSAGANAAGYVHCIFVDPTNADKVIVVYSNYSVRSLFYSSNGGTSWTDISGNLEANADGSGSGPSTRWLTAVFGVQTIYYVATSTGLYSTSTLNGASTVWAQEGSTTIGNVVCPMVKGRDIDGLVVVGTHGMGVYSAIQTPLPVELTSFSASVSKNTVVLKWETATEVNNYGYEIERSIFNSQSSEWQKIGFVPGAGNSNSPKYYSISDQPTDGTSFSYRLKQIDINGHYKYYDAITVELDQLAKAELMQNSPNPFNPSTTIKFYIPNNSDVSIKIYDMLGKEVTTLVNEQTTAGYHIVYWNGENNYGETAASGVYLYRLTAGSYTESKKMILLR